MNFASGPGPKAAPYHGLHKIHLGFLQQFLPRGAAVFIIAQVEPEQAVKFLPICPGITVTELFPSAPHATEMTHAAF